MRAARIWHFRVEYLALVEQKHQIHPQVLSQCSYTPLWGEHLPLLVLVLLLLVVLMVLGGWPLCEACIHEAAILFSASHAPYIKLETSTGPKLCRQTSTSTSSTSTSTTSICVDGLQLSAVGGGDTVQDA